MTPQEKQNLKARFLGMHIGCEVNVFKNGNAVCYGMNLGVAIHGGKVVIDAAPDRKYNDADFEFKLILRPLSDITDEEAIKCATIAASNFYNQISRHKDYIEVGNDQVAEWVVYIGLDQIGIWGEGGSALMDDIGAYDYLRSRNLCLPFHGLNPVAEGWAILETTNQPQG